MRVSTNDSLSNRFTYCTMHLVLGRLALICSAHAAGPEPVFAPRLLFSCRHPSRLARNTPLQLVPHVPSYIEIGALAYCASDSDRSVKAGRIDRQSG